MAAATWLKALPMANSCLKQGQAFLTKTSYIPHSVLCWPDRHVLNYSLICA